LDVSDKPERMIAFNETDRKLRSHDDGGPIDGVLELEEGKLRITLIKAARQSHTSRRKSGLEPSSALNQVNNQDDDRNYEQEMDQTAANVAKKAKKPEHDQDNNYSPEHGIPFG
jgi:hypothetical protein